MDFTKNGTFWRSQELTFYSLQQIPLVNSKAKIFRWAEQKTPCFVKLLLYFISFAKKCAVCSRRFLKTNLIYSFFTVQQSLLNSFWPIYYCLSSYISFSFTKKCALCYKHFCKTYLMVEHLCNSGFQLWKDGGLLKINVYISAYFILRSKVCFMFLEILAT